MGEAQARLGDTSDHGGRIITGATRTFINGAPAARKGDLHSCPIEGHGITAIETGSERTFIEGQSTARIGDSVGCGAIITSGSPDTLVG